MFAQDTDTARDGFPRVSDDWYVDFHHGLAARFWRAAGAAMVDDDMRVVMAVLDPGEISSVLDVPCGDGRITLRLAAAGLRAIGVDIAAGEVEHAQRAAEAQGVDARFLVGDLRSLPDVGPVDAVISWGNSFGYLTLDDTARSLVGMRRALRPGGRLVLESMTVAESLLVGGIKPEGEHTFGDVRMTMVNHYRAEESRLEADVVFEDAGRPRRALADRAPRSHHGRSPPAARRNFRTSCCSARTGESAYAVGSPRLIAVATA